jgi:hypothetical protein
VSRFANSNSKWGRFRARNDGNLARGFIREAAVKIWRRRWIRRLVRPVFKGREPEKWLFLCGCYNSGTTILRTLIEAHPEIAAIPHEGAYLTDAFPDLELGGWRRMMYANRHLWDLPQQGAAQRAAMARADWAIWWPRNARVFMEKSIDNSTRMRWLDRNFANAHFVAITRNGLCVNEGILRRAKPIDQAAERVGERYPPEMLAEQWVAFDNLLTEGGAQVARCYALRYEDLMADPIAVMSEIFQFLGMSVPAMSLTGSVLNIAGEQHEIVDQNAASLARLSETDLSAMMAIMRPVLIKHGYLDTAG